jgi:hypothetical protein
MKGFVCERLAIFIGFREWEDDELWEHKEKYSQFHDYLYTLRKNNPRPSACPPVHPSFLGNVLGCITKHKTAVHERQ